MNKLVVVTGGSKGIGKAIAARFAAIGYDIVICSRHAEDLAVLKQQWETAYGIKVFARVVDMSKKAEVEEFTAYILSLRQPIQVLVNNAGYFMPGSVLDEEDGSLESMIDSNVYSAYYMTRGIAPSMVRNHSGHIFNICSIASIMAYPNGGSYSISKFALMGFSKVLRAELIDKGVRVTAVLPGATLTSSWEGTDLPESRFMSIEDIAETVFSAFSLSERSVVEEIIIRPQLGDL